MICVLDQILLSSIINISWVGRRVNEWYLSERPEFFYERTEHYGGNRLYLPQPADFNLFSEWGWHHQLGTHLLCFLSLSGKVIVTIPGESLAGAVMACGSSTGATAHKIAENHIEMKAVDSSDIQIPTDTRLAMVATLQQSVEVGDHIRRLNAATLWSRFMTQASALCALSLRFFYGVLLTNK